MELHKQIQRFDKCNSHTYLGTCLPSELMFLYGVTLLAMIGLMGSSTILSFFKLTTSRLGEDDSLEALKTRQLSGRDWDFFVF